MNVNNLLGHVERIASKIATNWNYFLVISIGLVTALALENKNLDPYIGAVLLGCLTMFYISNHYRIYKLTNEIRIAESELNHKLEKEDNVTDELKKFYMNGYSHVNPSWQIFHVLVSIAVLGLIFSRLEFSVCG